LKKSDCSEKENLKVLGETSKQEDKITSYKLWRNAEDPSRPALENEQQLAKLYTSGGRIELLDDGFMTTLIM
jgi:hypothetical protein